MIHSTFQYSINKFIITAQSNLIYINLPTFFQDFIEFYQSRYYKSPSNHQLTDKPPTHRKNSHSPRKYLNSENRYTENYPKTYRNPDITDTPNHDRHPTKFRPTTDRQCQVLVGCGMECCRCRSVVRSKNRTR